jgi:Ser/Thr protein kinase RdoA (MazF antagonist)
MTISITHLVGSVLAHYGVQYGPQRIEVPSDAGGFSGAEIVQVECPAGLFCLRRWPDRALPNERILGLHRLMKTIHADGVTQVAVPVASLEGSTLLDVAGQFWQLEPWMPGRADFLANPNRERLASAMNCLSQWHTAAAKFQPQASEREWFSSRVGKSPAVSERLARIADWHSGRLDHLRTALHRDHSSPFTELGQEIASLFTAVSPTVSDELRSLTQTAFELQPCLRDVWHDHLLFTGNEVTGLIDPAACRTENIATDLSRLLGSLVGDDVAEWDFALECYSQHRRLSHAEHQLIGVLDRSGVLLSGMTWLDRIFLKHDRLARPDAVLIRLGEIHDRLRRLV